jgi:hypothetical protein
MAKEKGINVNKLSLSELERLLNFAAPDEPPVSGKMLRNHFQRASYRICGDAERKKVSLLKYTAWLIDERAAAIERAKNPEAQPRSYEEIKEAARERSAAASQSGRDIAPLPKVVDPERRARAAESLEEFCRTYFPETFYLEWSPDHHKVIAKIETAVRQGGLFAVAMPRGEGKTTICERAAIWALIYGYRKFVLIIGASESAAQELADTIKSELEQNDLLFDDFPEVCYPIRKLEGINNRASGQLLNGQRTHICWSVSEIVLPTVEGSPASGAIIQAVGITGRVRGMKRKANGKDIRPEMVIVDDPQTRESAESPEQCKKRMRTIKGDILGLAGPGKKISGVMPCTVIHPGDVADQVLDTDKNPEWNGERLALLRSFPKNMELWHRYHEISVDSYRRYGDNRDATEFYRDHRPEMDEGAESSWPQRFEPGELSGIQYAMDLYFKGRDEFFAEYQNTPVPEDDDTVDRISVDQVLTHLNHRKRGTLPIQANTLVMYIDVQKDLLYFVVCAFADDFTCWVIDYGAYPDQKRRHFTLSDAHPTYGEMFPGAGLEGAIYNALHALTDDYLVRDFLRDDGTEMRIQRCIIDSGWGRSTDSVYRAARESLHASIMLPSKGVGITAAQKPITEYRKNQGDKIGFNWWIPSARRKRSARLLEYDTNFWKSFFRERLSTAMGDPGSFSLWGSDEETHRMIAEHLASETSTPTAGRGRKVDIWKLTPGRENHFLDGVVGCMVGASLAGCELVKRHHERPVGAAAPRPPVAPAHQRVHRLGRVHELNQ